MRPGLRTLVDPEYTGHHSLKIGGNGEWSAPSTEQLAARPLEQANFLDAERLGHLVDGPSQRHRPPCGIRGDHVEAIVARELTDCVDVAVARRMALGELRARHHPALRRRLR